MNDFEEYAIYDIADVLKIYFRELPEPLLTAKLADTFLSIHQRKLVFDGLDECYTSFDSNYKKMKSSASDNWH